MPGKRRLILVSHERANTNRERRESETELVGSSLHSQRMAPKASNAPHTAQMKPPSANEKPLHFSTYSNIVFILSPTNLLITCNRHSYTPPPPPPPPPPKVISRISIRFVFVFFKSEFAASRGRGLRLFHRSSLGIWKSFLRDREFSFFAE